MTGTQTAAHRRADLGAPTRALLGAVLALALLCLSLVAAPTSAGVDLAVPARPDGVDLPVAFVENQGQVHGRARYVASGAGFAVFATDDGVHLSSGGRAGAGLALELRFVGARADVAPGGRDVLPGVVNVLRGPQERWRTAVPTYRSVVYPELWPGIDLVVYPGAGELKYEFVVRPGGDVSDIALRYVGATALAVSDDGGLAVQTPAGTLEDSAPLTYQDVDGVRVPVPSRFSLHPRAHDRYGFAVGDYDREQVLVIDPALDYATFLGGSSDEDVHDMAVDADGNVVVVGQTQSTDLPTTTGAVRRSFAGGVMDAFVAKLDAEGAGLVYATYLGGTPTPTRRGNTDQTEVARSVALDGSGNAYVTGQTGSGDFPTTSGVVQGTLGVGEQQATDAFVTKLTPTGALAYSTFLGGATGADDGRAIAVDGAGRAVVAGSTFAGDFPTTPAAFDGGHSGGEDVFVTRLSASASSLDYSTLLGGTDNELSHGVAVDAAGSAYVSGATRSTDFPSTAGAFQPAHSGGEFAELFEGFVTKLSPDGASLTYSTFLGGSEVDHGGEVAVDANGQATVLVATLSPSFPTTPGTLDTTFEGTTATALVRLGSSGAGLVWSTFLPAGAGLRVLSDGSTWVAGGAGAGAPTTPDAVQPENAGAGDAYVAHLDPSASRLLYASYFGGSGDEGAVEVDVTGAGDVYIAGSTLSADLPTTPGAFDRTWAGDASIFWGDGFVARFTSGTPPPVPTDTTPPTVSITRPAGGTTVSGTVSVTATASDDVAVTDVAVLVDGTVIGTDTTAPFEVPWDTTATPDGVHEVTATARDTAGNGASSAPVSVTVGAGSVLVALDWSETRADLDLRVRDAAGVVVLADTGTSRPVTASFTASSGEYRFEVTNTSRRSTAYTLTVTHPVATSPAGDTTPPTVSVTSPQDGATVSGVVSLAATAADDVGVAQVRFVVDGGTVASDSTAPYTAAWDSATALDGSHVVTATALDAAGNATSSGVTVTVANAPAQPSAAVSSLTLSPGSVTGGGTATGTVTLSAAAPSGGAVVALTSSDTSVATVPPDVAVAPGGTSASFVVSTTQRDSTGRSTISATGGGVTRTAVLEVTPPTSTDTVTIERAEYGDGELEVRASSSVGSATLTVHVTATGERIGVLSSGRGIFSWPTNPQNVTVRSSLGGSATTAVSSG